MLVIPATLDRACDCLVVDSRSIPILRDWGHTGPEKESLIAPAVGDSPPPSDSSQIPA